MDSWFWTETVLMILRLFTVTIQTILPSFDEIWVELTYKSLSASSVAHFIVTREPDNVVTLHNNYNYVAVVNGFATVHRAVRFDRLM